MSKAQKISLRQYIRQVPDWPKKGILFRDITPLLADSGAFDAAIEAIAETAAGLDVQYVGAVEARGFIFGSAVAEKLGAGFIPVRKKGKLPYKTHSVTYELEYGSDTVEVHSDAVENGAKVLMVDDLLATGGTMAAACELMGNIGADIVAVTFLIELTELHGRQKLGQYKINTIISY
ncbi:MAG: adenine phosphoribosyltransferase [Planctomycetes bacterium]|nr:adenine phosphoribosyltransferase [Planctomycetota bacterium]